MRFLSLFSGIEAASVAWLPLGFECAAVAEIEPFPKALLQSRFPDVPNLGDVTKITDEQIKALGPIDIVIGGSPCQDLSVSGKRQGLAGARSGLFFDQVRIFDAARHLCNARFLVWENVPGAFTSNACRDFALVVGTLAGIGLKPPNGGWQNEGCALGPNGLVEWCVLDAQWFGLAQRRERVFIVLDVGDWANRAPILLEPESLRGDHPPSRGKGQGVAGTLNARTKGGGGLGTDFECDGGLVPMPHADISPALKARDSKGPSSDGDGAILVPMAFKPSHYTRGKDGAPSDVAFPLTADADKGDQDTLVMAFHGSQDPDISGDVTHPVGRNQGRETCAMVGGGVRRLTPLECERLQGFPDDWTAIMLGRKRPVPAKDSPRYRAIGNSMPVPVIRWIGERIAIALARAPGQSKRAVSVLAGDVERVRVAA